MTQTADDRAERVAGVILGTAAILAENRAKAVADWKARAQLPPSRIIAGSAAAHLVIHNLAGEHLRKALDPGVVRANLRRLAGAGDDEALRQATGMPVIKERVQNYLHHERVGVLRKRCDGPIRAVLEAAHQVYDLVRQRFPEDPEEAKRQEEDERRIRFARWWGGEWEDITARLRQHYDQEVVPPEGAGDRGASAAGGLRDRYEKLIRERMAGLAARQAEVRRRIFDANSTPVFLPAQASAAWRRRLYSELSGVIEEVSRGLALELKAEATALVEFMREDLLYGSPKVTALVIGRTDDFLTRLEGKLQTLFLRFARPVIQALIRLPVGTPERRQLLNNLGADAELLDNYYGGEEAYRQLKLYARYGRDLLVHEPLRRKVLDAGTTRPDRVSTPDPARLPRVAETPEEVEAEVEADLRATEVYLLDAVFTAAGFGAFREQELDRLRTSFLDDRSAWAGVAENEYLRGNPLLLGRLPRDLQGQGCDTEVSDQLQ